VGVVVGVTVGVGVGVPVGPAAALVAHRATMPKATRTKGNSRLIRATPSGFRIIELLIYSQP
jgi:hypothetical protein